MNEMLTGICPKCKKRRILVVHLEPLYDMETGVHVSTLTKHAIRSHECGANLVQENVLTLENAYAAVRGGEERRHRITELHPSPRRREVLS